MKDLVGITERGDAALNEGWVDWVYKQNKPAILITKNAPLLFEKHPDIFEKRVIIHATCTGLGGSVIEPNVPKPAVILDWVTNLPSKYFKKIVLRMDPICPSLFNFEGINFNNIEYLDNVVQIIKTCKNFGIRCRISFLDFYNHVGKRFENKNIDISEDYKKETGLPSFHLPLNMRENTLKLMKRVADIDYEICGEPGMDCSGCISKQDLDILEIDYEENKTSEINCIFTAVNRPSCKCLALKKELLTNKHPCQHKCLYCYWKD